jgi:hypothetical protein
MKLKIKSCPDKTWWYANRIGEIFDYDKPPKDSTLINVKVPTDGKAFVWRVVEREDCERVN